MKKAQMGDWFIIFLLSKNLDSVLFKEFIVRSAVSTPIIVKTVQYSSPPTLYNLLLSSGCLTNSGRTRRMN